MKTLNELLFFVALCVLCSITYYVSTFQDWKNVSFGILTGTLFYFLYSIKERLKK